MKIKIQLCLIAETKAENLMAAYPEVKERLNNAGFAVKGTVQLYPVDEKPKEKKAGLKHLITRDV